VKKSFNIRELSNGMKPSQCIPLVKSFPKIPRTQSEMPKFGGSHSCKTKQISYIDCNVPPNTFSEISGMPFWVS
jgi:hypothetical protein